MRERLIADIDAIADKAAEEKQYNVACVLHSLVGTLMNGNEEELAQVCGRFSQQQIEKEEGKLYTETIQ